MAQPSSRSSAILAVYRNATRQLLAEVRDLDVESAELTRNETAPIGTKGDPITMGSIAIAALPPVLHSGVALVQAWVMRGQGRTVKFKGRGIEFEGSAEELEKTLKGIAGIRDEVDRTKDATDQLALAFSSSLGRFIESGGAGGIKSFFESLLQDVLKLTTQLLIIEPLTRALTQSLRGSGESGGLGSILSSIGGYSGGRPFAVGSRKVQAEQLQLFKAEIWPGQRGRQPAPK